MWTLIVRSAEREPFEYALKPGVNTLGRRPEADVHLLDVSASRCHAEMVYEPEAGRLTIRDLDSTNGTFVNRERLTQPRGLTFGDEVRIGHHLISLERRNTRLRPRVAPGTIATSPLTRNLLLESLDRSAVLLSDVAERLATVVDLDAALREVSELMRRSMGADRCEVILAERFDQIAGLGFPTAIARLALERRTAVLVPDVAADAGAPLAHTAALLRIRSALCVPVLSGEAVAALIYVYTTAPGARPFDQNDLRLAVAISHQAALTIERTQLLARARREQRLSELLRRFLTAGDVEATLQVYEHTGHLPAITEQELTVLLIDIQDSVALAEALGARRFSQLLSQYYQAMSDVVFAHGGMMHQYVGDGLMAVFGMFGRPEPQVAAVRAGLAMLACRAALAASPAPFDVGVGVNTGAVVAGYLEIRDRIEFCVHGDTVNVTQRLQAQARPNRLYIGPSTFAAVRGKFHTRAVGPIEVRGRTQPVEAFEVHGELPQP